MKTTRILGAVMALTISAAPVLGFANTVTKTIPTVQITAEAAKAGKWIKDGNRWWYRHNDGTYTKNDWEQIGGIWYHFDADGWMQTGWINVGGKWYYLNTDGSMRTNSWVQSNGKWYYVGSDGAMLQGQWFQNKYYLYNGSGVMVTGCAPTGANLNVWCNFNDNGECVQRGGTPLLISKLLLIKDNYNAGAKTVGSVPGNEVVLATSIINKGNETWARIYYRGKTLGWICVKDAKGSYYTGRTAAIYPVIDKKFK